ncbi:MAG TPA: M28 family peptidase [Saprospiraceae bacterium]|nr:M28 family peptidase [Saprospiraceae bacterium]
MHFRKHSLSLTPLWVVALFVFIATISCRQEPKSSVSTATEAPALQPPSFQMDSAFTYVEKQVSFGPRVPGSPAHEACLEWIVNKLSGFGLQVEKQTFSATIYTGQTVIGTNIITRINPDQNKRILLGAHWDSRFIAEQDADATTQKEPILGADDGGSGVGVLMEIARQLAQSSIPLGVDIIFFDVEDQGERSGANDSWCLGAQYWSREPHVAGYQAKYGILLDMVGAHDAQFPVEDLTNIPGYTNQVASRVSATYLKVWRLAQQMGKGNLFVNRSVGGGIDDHYFVSTIRGLPMIDIINKPMNSPTSFGAHWHTHQDKMDVIDRRTLRSVGQVLLAVLFREAAGNF